jgi:acyl-coenzyme A thioesterase PaaI-like protein
MEPTEVTGALFEELGDGVVRASAETRGPWDARAQHGGAPAALLGRAIERVDSGCDMRTARVSFDLLRPVPVGELRVEAELVRPGRRVQLVAARLLAGDELVMQALALRMRRAAGVAPEVPPLDGAPPLPLPGPEAKQPFSLDGGGPSFPDGGVELRFARGGYREPGPAVVWIGLQVPVVAGETPSALQRVLAAADFGNGVSSVLDWAEHVFINPDLIVLLERDAESEWIGLSAETTIGADGTGQATSTLYDERGRIGRATQSLFVDRR